MEDYGADVDDIDIIESMDEYHDAIAAFDDMVDATDDEEMEELEEAWDRAGEESMEWEAMMVDYPDGQDVKKPTNKKLMVVEAEAEDEHFAAVCEVLEEVNGWSKY